MCTEATSIPRLELKAATLMALQANKIIKNYSNDDTAHVKSIEYFSDSMAVLGWIKSTEKRKEEYVNFRLIIVHLNTNRDQWFYGPTHASAADNTTRY
jgi:hypothetical protein